MSSAPSAKNTAIYQGALQRNVVLGALQVLAWLFFHPTAWLACVARLDPHLPPDFGLLDLNTRHWRRPLGRRLIICLYLIVPLWVGLSVSMILLLLNPRITLTALASCVALSVLGSFLLSLILGAACVALG